jgi:hypothetical protein
MSGRRTGVLGPRGLSAVLAGCALAAAAAGPSAAHGQQPNPEVLWHAYPLGQSPRPTSVPEPRPRRARPVTATRNSSPRPIVVGGAAAVGALLAGGWLTLLLVRRARPALALRAPLPTLRAADDAPPSRSPRQRRPPPPAPETCWIVCWRERERAVFYAIARDREGRQQIIGESPAFTATPNAPLVLDGAALEALQSLAARLSDGGWEATAPISAGGTVWHAQELRRTHVATALRR